MNWLSFFLKNITKFRSMKYLFVGGVSAVVDILVFYFLFSHNGINLVYSSIIAFFFAVSVNYVIGNIFVFQSRIRFMRITEFSLVFIISASGLIWNVMLVYSFIYTLELHPLLSKTIAAAPVFLWNYTLRRNYIYKCKEVDSVG